MNWIEKILKSADSNRGLFKKQIAPPIIEALNADLTQKKGAKQGFFALILVYSTGLKFAAFLRKTTPTTANKANRWRSYNYTDKSRTYGALGGLM